MCYNFIAAESELACVADGLDRQVRLRRRLKVSEP